MQVFFHFLTINRISGKYYVMQMKTNTITEYEKRIEERKIVKKETVTTIRVSLLLLFSTVLCGLAAYYLKAKPVMTIESQERLYGIVSLVVIILLIVILAMKRTIYYSPRFIKENFTLTQVLQKWRTIDMALLAAAESIPLCGLVMAFLGMPFEKTFHLFVGPAILMILLMPLDIKIRSKLSILRNHFPDI